MGGLAPVIILMEVNTLKPPMVSMIRERSFMVICVLTKSGSTGLLMMRQPKSFGAFSA